MGRPTCESALWEDNPDGSGTTWNQKEFEAQLQQAIHEYTDAVIRLVRIDSAEAYREEKLQGWHPPSE